MPSILDLDPYQATKQTIACVGEERLKALIAWALLSPSPHNTQPWSWSVRGKVIELRGNYSRQLLVSDPDGRELMIGCGCALEHLLLRIGMDGDLLQIDLLPDATDPHLFARINFCDTSGQPYMRRPRRRNADAANQSHGLPWRIYG
jgi:hypothetical protein